LKSSENKNKPEAIMNTIDKYQVFKSDFETQKLQLSVVIDFQNGQHTICYIINDKNYSLFDFWRFIKEYHLEKIEQMIGFNDRLIYLRRIIPQAKIIKNKHFERFVTIGAPQQLCDCLIAHADRVINDFQAHADDIERYLVEQKAKVKLANKIGARKQPINSFENAAKDQNTLQIMFEILQKKSVINDQRILIKTSSLLYSLVKRFKTEGYFKKVSYKDLHPLVNEAFKSQCQYQTFNQAQVYQGKL